MLVVMLNALTILTGRNIYRSRVDSDNCASQNLMKKLGAKPNGISEMFIHREELQKFQEENSNLIDDKLRELANEFDVAPIDLVGHIQTERKEKRMDEFLIRLKDELSARSDNIVKEYIMNEEFLYIFENILIAIMNQRLKEKRTQLCNLLVSSIVTPNTSYDRTEEFQMLVCLLSIQHLNFLKVFYQYRDVPMKKIDDINNIWSNLKKTVSEDENFLIELISDLENRGIIHFFLQNTFNRESGVRTISDAPYITSKGIVFYQYIELNT